MVLSSGATGYASVDSGIVIERGDDDNVAFIWDESDDTFAFIKTSDNGTGTANINIGMNDPSTGYMNVRAGSVTLDDQVLNSTKIGYLSNITPGTASSYKSVILNNQGHIDSMKMKDLYLGDSGSATLVEASAEKLNLLKNSSAGTINNGNAVIYSISGDIKGKIIEAETSLVTPSISCSGSATISGLLNVSGGATIDDMLISSGKIVNSNISKSISFEDNNLSTSGTFSAGIAQISDSVSVTGILTAGTNSKLANITFANGSITSDDNTISFGTDSVTTGSLTASSLSAGSTNILSTLTVDGILTAPVQSKIGDITFANGSITSASNEINFGNDSIITTGGLESSSGKLSSTLSVADTITGASGAVLGNITISNGSISSSGTEINLGNDSLVTTGIVNAASGSKLGDITFSNGSIVSTSGKIDFDNENIETTGNLTANNIVGNDATLSGDVNINGTVTAASGSKLADFTFTNGTIKSTSGNISFDNENIQTTGSLSISSGGQIGNIIIDNATLSSSTSTIGLSNNNINNIASLTATNLVSDDLTTSTITASTSLTVGTTNVTGTILASLDSVTLGQSDNNKVVTQSNTGAR